tara:strand:- start:416 stop:616 length:201 start_codon:yes stop_codon:yes gene_type:complete
MDRDNIIEEGLFDTIKNKFKDWKKYDKITRVLMRDPVWKKNYKELEKNIDTLNDLIDKAKAKRGMK